MKKRTKILVVVAILAAFFITAASTLPEDKEIKIQTVKAVWGDRVPTLRTPQFFEQFMDVTAPSVLIDNWVILKRIRFNAEKDTVFAGIGMFNQIWLRK